MRFFCACWCVRVVAVRRLRPVWLRYVSMGPLGACSLRAWKSQTARIASLRAVILFPSSFMDTRNQSGLRGSLVGWDMVCYGWLKSNACVFFER